MIVSEYLGMLESGSVDESAYVLLIKFLQGFNLSGNEEIIELISCDIRDDDEETRFIIETLDDMFFIKKNLLGLEYMEFSYESVEGLIQIFYNSNRIIIKESEFPDYYIIIKVA